MAKHIKIEYKNHAIIEAALRAINGKKDSHTFYLAHQIDRVAAEAEALLDALSIPKKNRTGAIFIAQSGEELPSAYKYAAATTTVKIIRKTGGWYIEAVAASTLYPRSQPARLLRITQEQDAIAIAAIRKGYKII